MQPMPRIDWTAYQTVAEAAQKRYSTRPGLLDYTLDNALQHARKGQLDTAYINRFLRQSEINYSKMRHQTETALGSTEAVSPEAEVTDWETLDNRIMQTVDNPKYGEYVSGVARMLADGFTARDICERLGGSLRRVYRAESTLRLVLA
jgi:hypothetical protein